MTQEEIEKFLANTKIYVAGKSKEIQEKLFSLGYKLCNNTKSVRCTDKPFIYIDKDKKITFGQSMTYFITTEFREITSEQILSLELTEPTYRPFKDKNECWNEMHKHPDFGWLYYKKDKYYIHISLMGDSVGMNGWTFDSAFYDYIFTDGTPFGIKKE